MEWLNEGVGLIVLISAIVIILLAVAAICILLNLRTKIAVQRLKFLGFFSADTQTREEYAELTIGNKSLNEVGISELGIKNGKVTFDLSGLYKSKMGLGGDARIVIEQRSSLRFRMTVEELATVLTDGKKGKELKTLRLYAVDFTGTLYQGKIPAVQSLLKKILAENGGTVVRPALPAEKAPAAEATQEEIKLFDETAAVTDAPQQAEETVQEEVVD